MLIRITHQVTYNHLFFRSCDGRYGCLKASNQSRLIAGHMMVYFKFDVLLDLKKIVNNESLRKVGIEIIPDQFCPTEFKP